MFYWTRVCVHDIVKGMYTYKNVKVYEHVHMYAWTKTNHCTITSACMYMCTGTCVIKQGYRCTRV